MARAEAVPAGAGRSWCEWAEVFVEPGEPAVETVPLVVISLQGGPFKGRYAYFFNPRCNFCGCEAVLKGRKKTADHEKFCFTNCIYPGRAGGLCSESESYQ